MIRHNVKNILTQKQSVFHLLELMLRILIDSQISDVIPRAKYCLIMRRSIKDKVVEGKYSCILDPCASQSSRGILGGVA